MRAQGLTKTNHSTAQLLTTGLTDNSIDALWEYRYRVKTWRCVGSIVRTLAPYTYTFDFDGNLYNTEDAAEFVGGGGEADVTVGTTTVFESVAAHPWSITGAPLNGSEGAGGSLTVGDIAILRPEYAVVGPSTRAQVAITWQLIVDWNAIGTVHYIGNVSGSPANGSFSATFDGRTLDGKHVDDGSPGWTYTTTVTLTPLAWWPYSDGTTPIWDTATGAQLRQTYQTPM